jgi:hypothetical protein
MALSLIVRLVVLDEEEATAYSIISRMMMTEFAGLKER